MNQNKQAACAQQGREDQGRLRFPDQAQFNPAQCLIGLARAVKAAEACCGSCSALSASAAGDCAGREGMLTMAKVRGAS